jgi:hypothetical protein
MDKHEKQALITSIKETGIPDVNYFKDLAKYKMFVEDNYMLEFMIWEDKILPMKIANNNLDDYRNNDINSITE